MIVAAAIVAKSAPAVAVVVLSRLGTCVLVTEGILALDELQVTPTADHSQLCQLVIINYHFILSGYVNSTK